MAKFEITAHFKTHSGTYTTAPVEVEISDNIAYKLENSSYHTEVMSQVEAALPSPINGNDWRRQGYALERFSARRK